VYLTGIFVTNFPNK